MTLALLLTLLWAVSLGVFGIFYAIWVVVCRDDDDDDDDEVAPYRISKEEWFYDW